MVSRFSHRELIICKHCSKKIDAEAEICPKCGVRLREPPVRKLNDHKNPGLAAVLSFLLTGLGQIYNGQIIKGVMFIIIYLFVGVLAFTSSLIIIFSRELAWHEAIFPIGWLIFWTYGMYDARNIAKKINSGNRKE